jgi:hypothetical protein
MDFSTLDNFEGVKYIDDNYCDCCHETCNIPFYHSNFYEVDLCSSCYNNTNYRHKITNSTQCDLSGNITCKNCHIMIQNNRWKMIHIGCKFIILCDSCFSIPSINYFDLFQLFKILNHHSICYTFKQTFIDNSIVSRKSNVPIYFQTNKILINTYTSFLSNISHIPDNFGSVKKWCIFQDLNEIPFFNIFTTFIYDYENDRIGSVVIESDRTISFYILYDNSQEFFYDLNKWKQEYNFDKILYDKLKNHFTSNTLIDDLELSKICPTFSTYIVINKSLLTN